VPTPDTLAALAIDEPTLLRLSGPGPRYTSYPTAPEWRDDVREADALAACTRAAQRPDAPLSLYVHLPFCERLCLYCGCTVEIHGHQTRADVYLDALEREIAIVAEVLGARRGLAQMHWGGGTPTFLSEAQLARLHALIAAAFRFLPGAEVSVEVDPHVTTLGQADLLVALGFNRVSMGVQDFEPAVQQVVKRDQTFEETERLIARLRDAGIEGINVDLMYGLPEQTLPGYARTLDRIIALSPDRLAVFGYAHVPWMKPAQKLLERSAIPQAVERARLFGLALGRLTAAGYEVIGLDHFARPDDSLARALHAGTLHRNFMGYTTLPARSAHEAGPPAQDMIGLGMSAIGDIGGAFLQNARTTAEYEPALLGGHLATARGLLRTAEDDLRRAAILALMCRMRVDLDELEAETGRSGLAAHFATEWSELAPFADEGFCTLTPRRLQVTPRGRLFLRHMAMVFDAHLRARQGQPAAARLRAGRLRLARAARRLPAAVPAVGADGAARAGRGRVCRHPRRARPAPRAAAPPLGRRARSVPRGPGVPRQRGARTLPALGARAPLRAGRRGRMPAGGGGPLRAPVDRAEPASVR
jgi:oxygen-independent coproporphyrinogen III oxidase